jgi:N6-L-threonylcarbamoyladenine synthase
MNNLPKEHRIDALCITGNLTVKKLNDYFYIKQVRKHIRQIHMANILKGGIKKIKQLLYLVCDFRLFDKVKYKNTECFIFGRRTRGEFDLRTLDGIKICQSASYKKLILLEKRKSLLIERRI